ncbi:MAG: TIGR02186 family protein [Paracoccaceae bacterium]|nr:TIGR02186 family protein [Paracoccaceae bacterium]
MIRAALLFLLLALPATAEEVVAGLSQNRISITTSFDGSEILVFGAVKREAPIPQDGPLHVIVTVSGPSEPVTVRRKERRFGIWVNTDAVEVDAAPTFYAVATSGPWTEVIRDVEDLRHKVSIPRAIRSVGLGVTGGEDFVEALIRIRTREDRYQLRMGDVQVSEATLFRTSVALPANLTEGDYVARFFLTRDGRVLDLHETVIDVRKVGLERFLFTLAHDQPLVYGLMSLAIAIAAGWGASAAFRFIRF